MSDNSVDPSGNTEAFRAFTRTGPEEAVTSKLPLLIGGGVVVVALIALVAFLAL
ncbi:hypothetical protein ACTI_12940 [Actinoplanes sp. OR16]|uniref:hypothetical protein n=1 Tax=Actinoplanes sp. OR16 TaxID=946334 RepID=UPI000F6E4363|nr:hypothetical protein [Actinoplanes sp. OR16]BBH64609.1 hypothetical protein ACTI_12940 [Actinoplanes sp. OR16]